MVVPFGRVVESTAAKSSTVPLAALRRRAAAEVKEVLVHADGAEREARRTAETEEGTSEETGMVAPG